MTQSASNLYRHLVSSACTSIQAVIAYLDKVDPEVAKRARARYACFDQYAG